MFAVINGSRDMPRPAPGFRLDTRRLIIYKGGISCNLHKVRPKEFNFVFADPSAEQT